ncbi:MAG: beta-ketoacyl synthase chain length factor [Gammaproteobacteria bacterium]|nr:beta-ketoacyl synthase chain length factor [Gammaproteobacteria bacterium]
MNPVYVHAIGLAAPGIESWAEGRAILAGDARYGGGEWPRFGAGSLLPANERRRITPTIKLALQVAADAMQGADLDPASLGAVFASSGGDTELVDRICRALTLPERPVSPTQFHNSVHNAAAGYWAIACRSLMPYATVSAYDASFAAGLMEAAAQTLVDEVPILLVVYDYPSPQPLARVAQSAPPFGAAFAISAAPRARSDAALALELVSGEREDCMDDEVLEQLRAGNAAARALPLLGALARARDARVVLPHLDGRQLAVTLATS